MGAPMNDTGLAAAAGGQGGLQQGLLEVATALNQGLDREEVFQRIATQMRRLIPLTALTIARADPRARMIIPVFADGDYREERLALRLPYGKGLNGRVVETGQPVICNHDDSDDPSLEPEHVPGTPNMRQHESVMVVPLRGSDGVEGTLTVYRHGADLKPFTREDLSVAELFASQAQVALANAELYTAAEERAKRLAVMNEILRSTSANLDIESICRTYEQVLHELIPFTVAAVALETGQDTIVSAWVSEWLMQPRGERLQPASPAGWVIKHGRGYVLYDHNYDDTHGAHTGVMAQAGARAVVAAPLIARGRAFGAIALGHPIPGMYDQRTLELLEEIGLQLAAALDNALLYQEVLERKANQSRLLAKLISAQEEERRSIAADLHDDTIQVLAAAIIQVDRIAAADPEQHGEMLAKLRSTLHSAMNRARQLMFNLRPPVLDAEGLVAALRQQLNLLAADGGVAVELSSNLTERLDPTTETVIFRSLQEAMQNVRRHAQAKRVTVELRRSANQVTAVLEDDGVGFDIPSVLPKALADGHIGLHSLLERVHLAGGQVELRSYPGKGTRLELTLPLNQGGPIPEGGQPR